MSAQMIPALAGSVASILFVTSALPMLIKALRTRDLHSYSLSNIALSNLGNLVYWLYVAELPFGPVWLIHGFNTLSTLVMLIWYLRYGCPAGQSWRRCGAESG